jgi:tRNA dimethylallyltransferase
VTDTPRHAALVGPTASGKSALALELARRDPSWEIVSADSMQVYREMDIGTAKPTQAEQAEVRHHLLDVLDPADEASVAWFQAEARAAIDAIEARGRRALLVGGTGLYHRAVVDELTIPGRFPAVRAELEAEPDTVALHARLAAADPVAAARMEPTNRRRVVRALEVTLGSGRAFSSFGPGLDSYPPSRFTLVGVDRPIDESRARSFRRLEEQLAAGFVEEVRALRDRSGGLSHTASQALGYRELRHHLDGKLALGEAVELILQRTGQLARRQRAWFRRDPRVTWLDGGDPKALHRLEQLVRRGNVGPAPR